MTQPDQTGEKDAQTWEPHPGRFYLSEPEEPWGSAQLSRPRLLQRSGLGRWRDNFHNFPKETPTEPRNLLQFYKQR